MSRVGVITAVPVAAAAVLAIGLYAMKYEVARLETRAGQLERSLAVQVETLGVLQSEWSYLNRPDRLQTLALRHLNLVPLAVHKIGALDKIPLRAAPAVAENRGPLSQIKPATLSSAQMAEVGNRKAP
jgi:hypothetical protein